MPIEEYEIMKKLPQMLIPYLWFEEAFTVKTSDVRLIFILKL